MGAGGQTIIPVAMEQKVGKERWRKYFLTCQQEETKKRMEERKKETDRRDTLRVRNEGTEEERKEGRTGKEGKIRRELKTKRKRKEGRSRRRGRKG